MTNGDTIRSKMSDGFIAEHCFCAAICPGPECDGCPLEEVINCYDFGVRMRYLREENLEEVTTFSEEKFGKNGGDGEKI